jgi:hypothetical protein
MLKPKPSGLLFHPDCNLPAARTWRLWKGTPAPGTLLTDSLAVEAMSLSSELADRGFTPQAARRPRRAWRCRAGRARQEGSASL